MNALTFPILQLLADGKFHSGQALANQFEVSRATIWNAIQHAQQLGVEVFRVPGKGYKLPTALSLLDKHEILVAIGAQRSWFNVEVVDEVNSTNAYLSQKAAKGAPHASCVIAHIQTKGRGRRGREWVSQLGASLTFSLLWRFDCGTAGLSGLSLTVGVALIRALKILGIEQAKLKWPNDVLVADKKLAGILIDLQGGIDGPSAAVIGIGINCQLPDAILNNIDQPATDIQRESDHPINQNQLLGLVLQQLAAVLSQFEMHGFTSLREEWISHHAYQGQTVYMLMPDGSDVKGSVTGVAEDGILLVQTAYGLQRFAAGEISLRRARQT